MPTNIFGGGAPARAQVATITIGAPTVGDEFTLTVTLDDDQTRAVSYEALTGDTEADVLTGLANAWNDSDDPAFTGVTADADSALEMTLTSDNAGVPFDVVATASTGASITLVDTTPNSGPSDWNVDANWSLGRKPIAGDDIIIAPGATAILYHLNQSALSFASFKRQAGHVYAIGREGPPLGARGTAPRYYLRFACVGAVEIYGAGTFVAIDVGASAISPKIDHTGVPASNRDAAVYLKGSALNTPEILNGYVRCEQMTLNGDLHVTGSSVVILQDDCDCDPSAASTIRVSSPTASVIAYCGVDNVDLKKAGGYRQVKGVWTGTLTMRESCIAIADSEDTFGNVIAWGGTLVTDQTPGSKIFNAVTVNSANFVLKQLTGQVTINTLTENEKSADISATVLSVQSST